jgi:ketosteroid isomerase-like protein
MLEQGYSIKRDSSSGIVVRWNAKEYSGLVRPRANRKKEITTVADIDELRATFEQVVAAICRRDAGAYSNFWHEQIVAFPPLSPFAVEGRATLRSMAEANFAQNESVTFSPINPQCRVIGSTGIVWGHTALTRKPKDGPLATLFARFTFVFAKTDGQWREVAVHVSQLPTAG